MRFDGRTDSICRWVMAVGLSLFAVTCTKSTPRDDGGGNPAPATATPTATPLPSPTPTLPPPGNWSMQIGDYPCALTNDSNPTQPTPGPQVVQVGQNSIQWHSNGSVKHVYVILHVPHNPACTKWPNPFLGADDLHMQDTDGRDLYAIGDAGSIDSKKVASGACPSIDTDQKTWIKYDQYVKIKGNLFLGCDGWIVIKP
jgi:hypothetical protein